MSEHHKSLGASARACSTAAVSVALHTSGSSSTEARRTNADDVSNRRPCRDDVAWLRSWAGVDSSHSTRNVREHQCVAPNVISLSASSGAHGTTWCCGRGLCSTAGASALWRVAPRRCSIMHKRRCCHSHLYLLDVISTSIEMFALRVLPAAAVLLTVTSQGGQWVLTFEDDFPGSTLNTSNWTPKNYSTQDGGLAIFVPDMVSVANGNLVLTTALVPGGGVFNGVPFNFTSGWVDSQNKWWQRNGRFEASVKLPVNNASCAWPAWWLLPNPEAACWPIGGELDIFEGYAGGHYQHNDPKNPYSIASTYHWGFQCYKDCEHYPNASQWYPDMNDLNASIIDFTASFHVFGVEVNDTGMRFYVGNVTTMELVPEPQSSPTFEWGASMYPPFSALFGILNVAVSPLGDGCFKSGWWQTHNATMEVDWVRTYQWVPTCAATALDAAAEQTHV